MSQQDRADDYMANQIGRLDDEVAALKAANAQAIAAAVEMGITRAVSNPALWEAAGFAMRQQAQSAAGGWLLGGIKAAATRAAWVIAIVAGVYALGGWGAVLALLKGQAATP
jgi:hypothetical protein